MVFLLPYGHAVAAARGNARKLHAGGTCADNQYSFRSRTCRLYGELTAAHDLCLAPNLGIYKAGYGLMAHYMVKAALIAAYAGADL